MNVILEAAIRVLEQDGWEALTTSRVAEVAGVSVGTLYQYFAHRESIIEALQDRELERASALLERMLLQAEAASHEELARNIVEGLLKLYRAAPTLHRVLASEGLRFSPAERVIAFDARSVALLKVFLSLAGPRIRQTNLEAAAFIIYQAVRATMLAYLLESPVGVTDSQLVDELTELIVRYLQSDR